MVVTIYVFCVGHKWSSCKIGENRLNQYVSSLFRVELFASLSGLRTFRLNQKLWLRSTKGFWRCRSTGVLVLNYDFRRIPTQHPQWCIRPSLSAPAAHINAHGSNIDKHKQTSHQQTLNVIFEVKTSKLDSVTNVRLTVWISLRSLVYSKFHVPPVWKLAFRISSSHTSSHVEIFVWADWEVSSDVGWGWSIFTELRKFILQNHFIHRRHRRVTGITRI